MALIAGKTVWTVSLVLILLAQQVKMKSESQLEGLDIDLDVDHMVFEYPERCREAGLRCVPWMESECCSGLCCNFKHPDTGYSCDLCKESA